jgi:hypothetical protein
VSRVREDARHRFTAHVRGTGADGAIVDDMALSTWEVEPSENHRDLVAEATVFGTAVARFHTGPAAPSRSLTFLPLRRMT